MKKLVFVLTLTCLLCLTACQAAESTVTTLSPTVPSNAAPVDDFDPALWNEYSDYELIEMTMESPQNEFRQLCSVWMTAEEWKNYMLENCEPLRALMLRDTAFFSLEEHAGDLVERYQDDSVEMRADNFVLLVLTLHPEMEQQFADYEFIWPPALGTEPTIAVDISKK